MLRLWGRLRRLMVSQYRLASSCCPSSRCWWKKRVPTASGSGRWYPLLLNSVQLVDRFHALAQFWEQEGSFLTGVRWGTAKGLMMFGCASRTLFHGLHEHDVDRFQLIITSSRFCDLSGQLCLLHRSWERRGFANTSSWCSDATESSICSFWKTRAIFIIFKRVVFKGVAGVRVSSLEIVKIDGSKTLLWDIWNVDRALLA